MPIGYTVWLLISESLEVYGASKGGLNFLKSWLNYLRNVKTVRHNKTVKRDGTLKVYLVNICNICSYLSIILPNINNIVNIVVVAAHITV